MDILIDDNEARFETMYYQSYTYLYWGSVGNTKKYWLKRKILKQAIIDGFDYVEISVANITHSNKVKLENEFIKLGPLKGRYTRHIGPDRVIDQTNFTSVLGSVQEFGRDTLFKFRLSIEKLLSAMPNEENPVEWFYTLGKEFNGQIFLLLILEKPTVPTSVGVNPVNPDIVFGPPPSHGVKVPGGQG